MQPAGPSCPRSMARATGARWARSRGGRLQASPVCARGSCDSRRTTPWRCWRPFSRGAKNGSAGRRRESST
eukprot:8137440-Pyramimonas_sp.AAC.1